jgi:hypothetical protein
MCRIAIQVQDVAGNWLTLQYINAKTRQSIQHAVLQARSIRPNKTIRAIDPDNGLELSQAAIANVQVQL